MSKENENLNKAENSALNIADVSCRSIPEILEKIEIYKSEQKRYENLCKDYPNDFDFKREMYGYASKVFALEWVLSFKNGS